MASHDMVYRIDLIPGRSLTWQLSARQLVFTFSTIQDTYETRVELRKNISVTLDKLTNHLRTLTIDFVYDMKAVPPFVKEFYYNRSEDFFCIFFVDPETYIDGETTTISYLNSRLLFTYVDKQLTTVRIPNTETTIFF